MKSRDLVLIAAMLVIALLVTLVIYLRRVQRKPPSPDLSPIKPPWVYWSWRVFVPLAYAIFAAGLIYALVEQSARMLVFVNLVLWPFILVTVFAMFTLQTFSFDYSVFGKYRRTPFPSETPLHEITLSYAIIGKVRTGPLVIWLLYRHGIGIKIVTIGDVFLPLDEVDTLEIRGRFLGLTSELIHHCPEVASPIGVPNKVAKIMAAYYPEKVLVPTESV